MDTVRAPKRRRISAPATMHFDQIPDDCLWIIVTFLHDFEKAIVSACDMHLRWIVQSHSRLYGPVLYHPSSVFGPRWLRKSILATNVHSQTMQGVVISAVELPPRYDDRIYGYDVNIWSFVYWPRKVFVVILSLSRSGLGSPTRLHFGSSDTGDKNIDSIYIVNLPESTGSTPTSISGWKKYIERGKRLFRVRASMCRGCGELYGLSMMCEMVRASSGRDYVNVETTFHAGPWSPVIRDGGGDFVACFNCGNRFCHKCAAGFQHVYTSLLRMNEMHTLCPLCFDHFERVHIPKIEKRGTELSLGSRRESVGVQELPGNVGALQKWLGNARKLSNETVELANALAEQVGALERQAAEIARAYGRGAQLIQQQTPSTSRRLSTNSIWRT